MLPRRLTHRPLDADAVGALWCLVHAAHVPHADYTFINSQGLAISVQVRVWGAMGAATQARGRGGSG